MATINDVARASGVSPTTVSFVLNNGPRPVSAKTRERVLEAIARLDFQPSALARGLARQRMHTLGILFSGHEPRIVHNPYAVALLDGIVAAATTRGYNVTLITRHWQAADDMGGSIFDGRTDGTLLISPFTGADATVGRSVRDTPLVQIGGRPVLPGTCWVDVDNEGGARRSARHLIDLGHRHIAMLLDYREYEYVGERQRFFLDELASAGIPLPAKDFIIEEDPNLDPLTTPSALADILRREDRPTAVLATSDRQAFYATRTAQAVGLSVPGDLSVIGFDDAPGSGAEMFGLTTMRQPLFEMGQAAAVRLVDRIEKVKNATGDAVDFIPPLLFDAELIVRASTSPIT